MMRMLVAEPLNAVGRNAAKSVLLKTNAVPRKKMYRMTSRGTHTHTNTHHGTYSGFSSTTR